MKLVLLTVLLIAQMVMAAIISISGNTAQTLVTLFSCYITYDAIEYVRDKS